MGNDRGEAEYVPEQAYDDQRAAARRLPLREPAGPALHPGVDSAAVVEALRCLPADQRRALVLHHVADLSLEQIAAQTGASISAVASGLSRGRAALARLLHDAASPSAAGRRTCSTGVEH